jgi:hypothetical protein
MRKNISSDCGDSGSKKYKRGYGGIYGEIWQSSRFAKAWSQVVGFVLLRIRHPENGGSTHLRNFCLLQRDYKAQYPRRLSSSYSLPWEPQISRGLENSRLDYLNYSKVYGEYLLIC